MTEKPRIEFKVPDGWAYREQVTVTRTGDTAGVSANVIASSEPIESGKTASDYAKAMGGQYEREFPGYAELAFEEIDIFGGTDGWLRQFSWEPEPGLRIDQMQAYYTIGDRSYMATASAEADDFDNCKESLVEILNSLSVRRP